MLREISPCAVCNRKHCGLLDLSRGLRQEPEIRIRTEAFCPDAKIPVTGGCLLTVKSGAVKMMCHGPRGPAMVIDFLLPGDMIGLETLTDAEDTGVDYRATASAATICRVGIDAAVDKQASSQFCHRLSAELAMRIRANFHHRQIVTDSAWVRMAHYLLQLTQAGRGQGGSQGVVLPNIARADIASYLHLRAETVSRVLSSFRQNGWVQGPLHRLEVIDVNALAALTQRPDTTKRSGSTGERAHHPNLKGEHG
ncbi:MAG: Crp/Fnr family transcriptional regulator [Thiomonas sp.]|nr:Crp/Fnr family transcriptional regulator [Thiomonas sp.]